MHGRRECAIIAAINIRESAMPDTKTQIQGHADDARRLLDEADYEIGRCNYGLTSEKLWGAAASAVKAVCLRRGWQHDEYQHLRDAVARLKKETGDDSISMGFSIAYDGQLFIGSLEEDEVDTDRPVVRRLVDKLLAAADAPELHTN